MKAQIKLSAGLYRDVSADELVIIKKALDITRRPVIETTNEEVICDMIKWLQKWGYLTEAQINYMSAIIEEIDEDLIIQYLWDTDSNTIKITEDIIEAGKSNAGGWKKEQLALLGIDWPPTKGWKDRIIGELMPESIINKFIGWKK